MDTHVTKIVRRKAISPSPHLRLVATGEPATARRRRADSRELQLLVAEYWPVTVFAVARIAVRIRRWRRNRSEAGSS